MTTKGLKKPNHVFISYNKADINTALEIALFIVVEGIDVWYGEWEIEIGDSNVEKINMGLRKCSHFIIIWSKYSSASHWVNRELSSTLAKSIKTGSPKIIPILLDNTPLPSLLSDINYHKYEGGTENDRRKIIRAILGKRPTFEYIRAIVKKYHEVIYESEAKNPFGIKFCPKCGGDRIKGSTQIDYEHDNAYHILACEECGWSDWTQ